MVETTKPPSEAESETDPAAEARPRLLVGLGNPGARYRDTRHNVGFRVIAELARRWRVELPQTAAECKCIAVSVAAEGEQPERLLAMPQTYMNRSGHAVRCLVERRAFEPPEILVIYDEVHLPLGKLRLRPKGNPAGHRGMESVLEGLRTDEVPRLRLGVAGEDLPTGEEGDRLPDYVLSPFAAGEQEVAAEMILRAADASEEWLRSGIAVAMGRTNG